MIFIGTVLSLALAASSALAAPLVDVDITKRAAAVDQLVGYATQNGGTTGGTGGKVTTVTTLSALRSAVTGTDKKIVVISGVITGDGKEVDVGSNTSIFGANGGSVDGLTGGGFRVKEGKNVIIRNLQLSKSKAPTDLVAIQYDTTNVWVDHCEFFADLAVDKDYYDGALDISHAADFVTVSWNTFHDTYKTSLVGHSDNNKAEDTGHLRVTYHHNYFYNLGSRLPSLRFGTGHVYNNYYKDVKISGIDSRVGAQILIESNNFNNVLKPIMTTEKKGYAVQKDNIFINSDEPDTRNVGTLTNVPYTYTLDAASAVPGIVQASAGINKITNVY